jgi:valyl-tRNA synthetase
MEICEMSVKSSKTKLEKKRYKPSLEEHLLFNQWQNEKLYKFNFKTKKEVFIIDTPPPYSNASWHMGGAIHYSQIDMTARTMRMKGYEVLFPMGLDRNGLPIEVQTEKENNINMHEIEREEFLKLCKSLLDKYGDQILNLTRKLGMSSNSFDWDEIYKTDEEQYRALTQSTFIEMWNKGYIYEDNRPNNWDPQLQTTVADAEIVYKDGSHILYDIEFTVKETNKPIIVATTRPELIPVIGIIIFHPNDKRYKHLEGKNAKIPLWNIEVPIRAHYQADPDFGQGIMMICSFGDITDVRLFREFGLQPQYAIGPDGKMTKKAGEAFEGMTVRKARKAIIDKLRTIGKVIDEKTIQYRFPVSDRSAASIEFIGMPEYYLKQENFVDQLRNYTDEMNFHPPESKQILLGWLDNISMDWPITRRRFYGTEVPLWYCTQCDYIHVPKSGLYYQPWKDPAPIKTCPKCRNEEFRGDERIFDTWIDSSISAYYIQKFPHNQPSNQFIENNFSNKSYICDLRPQGKDIVRTWLHYSMLRGHLLFGKSMFKHVWISGHILDEKGEKMCKSKGNIVRPEYLLEKFGGDAIRLYGALEGSHGSDFRFSINRLEGNKKFLNKIYNIARFISNFKKPQNVDSIELQPSDKWILSELAKTLEKAYKGYGEFNFNIPAKELRKFTRDIFAGHYLELVKSRAYNNDNQYNEKQSTAACWTLHYCLGTILRTIAPIIPFLTDYLYRKLYRRSIHTELFSKIKENHGIDPKITNLILTLNNEIWKLKKKSDPPKSLRDPINVVEIPEILKPFRKDLKQMHNIKEFKIS